jgi:putative membrane protein
MKRSLVSGTAIVFALGGCSTGGEQPARPAAGANRPAQSIGVPAGISSSRYFAEASAIDLFQLRAADIALQRGTGRARSFAVESKRQHQAISAQLSFAGRYLNMLPARVLPPNYQQMLAALLSANDFNATYLDQQRRLCERALKLHTDYARSGDSPTLRPVAKFAASAVQSELQLLRG